MSHNATNCCFLRLVRECVTRRLDSPQLFFIELSAAVAFPGEQLSNLSFNGIKPSPLANGATARMTDWRRLEALHCLDLTGPLFRVYRPGPFFPTGSRATPSQAEESV